MKSLPDEVADLERIVYSRPVGAEGERRRAEATERLRQLRAEAEARQAAADAALAASLAEPLPATPRRSRRLLIAAGALVALAAAVVIAIAVWPQPDSLDIFERPATTEEQARLDSDVMLGQMSVAPTSLRFLTMSGSREALGYLMDGSMMGSGENKVCLIVFEHDALVTMGGCVDVSEFRETGIDLQGVRWGPTGGVRWPAG